MLSNKRLSTILERAYAQYNRADLIHPDPLEFVYRYDHPEDREVVGFLAASLAYGRVAQILKSVSCVLDILGESPASHLRSLDPASFRKALGPFRHRWTSAAEMEAWACGVKCVLRRHGSLEACFKSHYDAEHPTLMPALAGFIEEVRGANHARNSLLPDPNKGSACKRHYLFLRWMIRMDAVDPGCWSDIPSDKLIVPLDTHMHRVSRALGLTARKQANLKTALEVTDAFKKVRPDDPLRYDFALTRLGIRSDADMKSFLAQHLP